jgi:hypothetical protein
MTDLIAAHLLPCGAAAGAATLTMQGAEAGYLPQRVAPLILRVELTQIVGLAALASLSYTLIEWALQRGGFMAGAHPGRHCIAAGCAFVLTSIGAGVAVQAGLIALPPASILALTAAAITVALLIRGFIGLCQLQAWAIVRKWDPIGPHFLIFLNALFLSAT